MPEMYLEIELSPFGRVIRLDRTAGDTSRELNDSDAALAGAAVAKRLKESSYFTLFLVEAGEDLDVDIQIGTPN
jgi:hypothetical protein